MPELKTSVSSHVFYRKLGAGPVMVLLHGFPESSSLWRNIWNELSLSFTLIIPDMPGIGQTVLDRAVSITDMAVMIKEILDAEGAAVTILAGHSMGGYIAIEFARLYPHAVAGISFVHSAVTADDEEKKKTRNKVIKLVNAGGKDLFLSEMVPNLFAARFNAQFPLPVKEQVDEALKMEAAGVVNFYEAMRDRANNINVLPALNAPVQWIAGTDDTIMHYKIILTQCHLSAVNFVSFYEGCGHMSMVEMPGRLAGDLNKFGIYCHHKYMSAR